MPLRCARGGRNVARLIGRRYRGPALAINPLLEGWFMAPRVRSSRPHLWVLPLCVAAALVAPSSAGAVSSTACSARVNNTPSKLVECIRTADLWNHMKAFQAIADANPGADGHPSRNSGEPGYKA